MTLSLWPVEGIGEIMAGDDLAEIIAAHADLHDGDVVVVTSKIVSKANGLSSTRSKDVLLAEQTDRIVARRGATSIVRTLHGLTLAAAGIDASNTTPGTLLLLPDDPDGAAREIRQGLRERTGVRIAVVVSDTAGRAWRVGQTDIAIGCAGLTALESFEGREDSHGNALVVTEPAIADQLAGAAELTSGKLSGCPVVIARGTNPAWHTEDDGPGAATLIREEDGDLFGLGAREAVLAAVTGTTERGFPTQESDLDASGLIAAVADDPELGDLSITLDDDHLLIIDHPASDDGRRQATVAAERLRLLAAAYRQAWTVSTRMSS